MRRFYAAPLSFASEIVTLDEGETRHLRDVLRLRDGEIVYVFDGEGREFECRIERIEKRASTLTILNKIAPTASESSLDLTLAAAILKGDKTDVAVQKAVELGVNRFIPMLTGRCDVKVKDGPKRVERWRKIALEATKQCGRSKLMTVEDVVEFDDLIASITREKKPETELVFFSERDGESFSIEGSQSCIVAFLGPEGGWDDAEIETARRSKAKVITFGGRIMKADTAAIAISAILQHNFGDLN